ncbi:hypothetical protein ACQHIV_08380 [Kribbella sp. GL6]|uniref:hypothetical protein n=1 Tax=Kribbella sp. GL6 TaxID=3419765 RepID=UPI003D0873A4
MPAASDLTWRLAQRGAVGSLIGHWSMPRQPPEKVLVVVPTQELRRRMASAFGAVGTAQDRRDGPGGYDDHWRVVEYLAPFGVAVGAIRACADGAEGSRREAVSDRGGRPDG